MPKKLGPPYLDDPECKFVVVENPWPGVGRDVVRNNTWFKQVAVWLRFALNQTAWPEFVYHRNTRGDLVVVQFPENVDITPLLGTHFWPNFFTPGGRPPEVKMSHIFEFNYRRHGHPETHQWSIYEVDTSPPPREWGPVPIKQPYPQPTWDSNAGRTSSDLTLPIPQPQAQPIPQQPAPPSQQPPAPQPAAQPPQARDPRRRSSLYTFADDLPDAPAPQPQASAPGAGSSAPRDAPQPGSSQSLPQQQSPKLYEGKGDPYEEEEMASKALKSEPVEASVKPEPEPQNFSIGAAQLEALRQARAARASQSHTATTSPKSRTAMAEPVPRAASATASPSQSSGVVKPEPRDDVLSARVKREPGTEVVPPGGHSRDPRAPVKVEQYAAQIPSRPNGSAPSRVKRELEEDGQADAKRPRTNTPPASN